MTKEQKMSDHVFDYEYEDSISTFEHLSKIMNKNYPSIEWLVEGLIPEESIVIMSAKPASLKTWLAFDIAIKVSSGQLFLEKFKTKKTGVLILDGESGPRLLKNRFTILGYTGETPIHYRCYSGGTSLDEDKIFEIKSYCIDNDIGLIIVDSFARFSGLKDENSATEVAKAFRQFAMLRNAGLSVVFISHSRKSGLGYGGDGLDSVRGSSDIVAACDIHLGIVRKPRSNTITITQFKNRLDEEWPPFKASFTKDSAARSYWQYAGEEAPSGLDDEADKEAIITLLQKTPNLNQKQILEALRSEMNNIGEHRLRHLLTELENEHKIVRARGERTELLYSVKSAGESQND